MREREPRQREWRFLQLTVFMAAWMLLAPLMRDRWLVNVLLQAFLLNSVLVTLWANPEWIRARSIMIGLWLFSLACSAFALAPLPPGWQQLARSLDAASFLPLLALLAVGILRFVFRSRRLTADGIVATVAVYVLIALSFAQLYTLVIVWDPQSFNLPVTAAERSPQLLQVDLLYFSLITLATVGYGDILPLSDTARMLAAIEAIVGQFYVAVVVAVFVGMFAAQRRD